MRTSGRDEQGAFTNVSPPLQQAWFVTYRPVACSAGTVAREQVHACMAASRVRPGQAPPAGSTSFPGPDAALLGCPVSVGGKCAPPTPGERYDCPVFYLEPESTRRERRTQPDACCYGHMPVCQFAGPVPGRGLFVDRTRIVASRTTTLW